MVELAGIHLNHKDKKYHLTSPFVIENSVNNGGNCTIYQGVTIHHHSIVIIDSSIIKM